MKKIIFIFLLSTVIFIIPLYSLDISAYIPVEFSEFKSFFYSQEDERPGMKMYRNSTFRVHGNLHVYPIKINDSDINNIRATFRSLGLHPDQASGIGYKVEYIYPSDVSWQKDTKLVFYIQNVQREHFEKDFKLNDPIYWFIVFRQFNTFTQEGYFLVSNFMNEEQFRKIVSE